MSRGLFRKALIGLTRNVAFTAPGAEDPRLRGRTYAIPFEDVWQVARSLLDGGLRGWRLLEADDREGVLRGSIESRLTRFASRVTVRISLDDDAQTRVDAMAAARVGRYDLGVNARRLHRFFQRLDRGVAERRGRATPPVPERRRKAERA